MNHKVLLADDSLTIQKVIKITLANQPYDITDCSTEEELFHQLPIVQPKLVFLDFNLSEKYTGYELTTKIKSLSPTTKVLLLLGTFDTVDDDAMEKCGASDKIVKPFDSNKFIAICKQLIETFADEDIPYPEPKAEAKESSVFGDNEEEQWTVSHSTEQKFKAPEKELDNSFPEIQNPLAKEVSDWGMSVPGVINDKISHDKQIDLPPVIGEVKSLDEHRAAKTESPYATKFPASDDLDYPTIEEKPAAAPASAPATKLISIESFNEKPMELEIEGSYVPDESDVSSIEAQIRDEVEENLWQADEFEDLKKEVSQKIEEVKTNFHPSLNDFDESLFKPLDENESIDWHEPENVFNQQTVTHAPSTAPAPAMDMNAIRNEMEQMVKKYVKEYMDEYFKQNTEKVAWEVIPDLAENLIRQELSKISNKILED
ncbi:MAG: response regulator [Bacteriovoracaceae bacterium]|nr:response regulator [Bacteriovoracaceae bacterium]